MRFRRSIQGFIASLLLVSSAAYSAIDVAQDPLFLSTGAGANVLLNMSVETPMGGGAYNDAPGSIPGCTGRKSVGGVGSNLGTCYFPNYEYIGYFDPKKCYSYSGGTYVPTDLSSADHSCNGGQSGRWSGNFMNWAGMTAIDTYILTMTGGRRVVDTTARTVVERSLAFVAGYAFHTKAIGSSVTNSVSGVPLDSVTPYNDSWARIVQNQNSSAFTLERSSGSNNTFTVRAEVCNPSISLESYCVARTDGSNDYYKPEGLLQRNAKKMRFGVMAYTTDNSHTRQGGVLRSNMKSVGPTLGTGEPNPSKEYNEDGLTIYNPDGAPGANSGVINYVNSFAVAAGQYKSFDPVSELFYEASRYFRGMTPTPSTYSGLNTSNDGGFPLITNWQDPIQYECQKNFMVAINDAFPWNDKRLPGTHFPGGTSVDALGRNINVTRDNASAIVDPNINVTTLTDNVGALEQAESGTLVSKIGTTQLGRMIAPGNGANLTPTNGDGRGNSYYLAGIAHYLNTEDVSALPGDQTVTTFMIDSQEYNANPTLGNVNPLWLAGKYGGFKDDNGDKIPQASEWDADNDGQPDNYVLATEPSRMVQKLQESFDAISLVTEAAGTAVAVNSTELQGDSRIYQATFATTDWSGELRALSLDVNANVGAEVWNVNDKMPSHTNRNIFTTVNIPNGSGGYNATPLEFTDANVVLASGGGGTTTTSGPVTVGTANQSSNYFSGGAASNAFDGNTDGAWANGSVSHTSAPGNANEWWEVDLQSPQDLSYVELFNRTDTCGGGVPCQNRLSNAFFMVSDTPFTNNGTDSTSLKSSIIEADYVTQITGDPIRINAGETSNDVTDAQGREWLSDRFFVNGNTRYRDDSIANTDTGAYLGDTTDEIVYESFRRGDGPSGSRVASYDIPLSNANINHTIILHFNDRTGGGDLIQDVIIEGAVVADDLNIAAGGKDTASVFIYRHDPAGDGLLDLDIQEVSGGRPRISAIEVIPDLTSNLITQNVGIQGQYIRIQKAGSFFNTSNIVSLAEVVPYATTTTTINTNSANIVNYIRGDQSLEVSNGGSYRDRSKLLGDVINSTPASTSVENYVYDRIPGAEGTSYSTFLDSKVAYYRANNNKFFNVIYVGANDGMLHAFKDTYDTSPSSAGEEVFAYIPSHVHNNLESLTDPNYTHQSFVDASPATSDVYINSSWQTMLVGGLGAGGRGLFALDITDPLNFSASDVMWEFRPDSDPANGSDEIGILRSQAQIVRMHNGKYGVIVGNGYNSASQKAQLIILDAEDGSIMSMIDTGVGSLGNENGLAEPLIVDTNFDRIADYAYAGDLHGNMWKFDLTATSANGWNIAYSGQPLFTASDANGNMQQITTKPDIKINPNGGFNILFGTGKYFEIGDNVIPTNPVENSFYSIQDNGSTSVGNSRSVLVQQYIESEVDINDVNGNLINRTRITSENTVNYGARQGWYIDLLTPGATTGDPSTAEGERVIVRPVVRFDNVIFLTLIPSANPCDAGGAGWGMVLDALSGARAQDSVIDLNGDNVVDDADEVNGNVGSGILVGGSTGGLTYIGSDSGVDTFAYQNLDGSIGKVRTKGEGDKAGRQSWRQIQ